MRIARRRSAASADFTSLPSLSDIAFLLLIFFLVSTSFAVERGLSLILPQEGGARPGPAAGDRLLLTARADGTVSADGRSVPASEVESEVRRRIAASADVIVVVDAEAGAEYRRVVALLDAVKKAQARRVSLKMARRAGT